jgi:hypothetical protein
MPAPEIGNVVYSASDVDARGYSTDPAHGPMVMWRRVTLSLMMAFVAFAACWFSVLGAIAGAIAFSVGFHRMGKTKRAGSCVYVGTDGVTCIAIDGKQRTITTAMFREDIVTTTDHERVFANGIYAYSVERITFLKPDGSELLRLVGTYELEPSPHAHAVRAAIYMAGIKRAHAAAWRLARGERVVFPLLGKAGEAIVLDARTLAYYRSATSAPLVVERSRASLALRQGYLDLTTRDGSVVLGRFERSRVSNYDVLQKLVA